MSTKQFMPKEWHVVRAPVATRIKTVAKEAATQGKIYFVWDVDNPSPHCVSQSLPVLLETMNRDTCTPKRLSVAACYRIVRGECAQGMHQFH